MQLILHIGMAKTGTSTLQHTLNEHRELLLEEGVLYPAPKYGKENHNLITTLVHPFEDMPREFTSGGRHDFQAIHTMGEQFLVDIEQQVRRAGPDVVILSGEYFVYLSEPKVMTLRSLLERTFDDIHVVCYVRHPAAYYVSLMQQQVKASSTIRAPANFRMRAKVCISRFVEAFEDNVSVRRSDRETLHGGCIVRDFLHAFIPGGDVIARRLDVGDQNESMSAEGMCILQRLRRYGWPDQDDHFMPESSYIMDVLNEMRGATDQTRASLRPEVYDRFMENHRGDIAFLHQRFGVTLDEQYLARRQHDEHGDEPPGWNSTDLGEVLHVESERLEGLQYQLLKELARRQLDTRADAPG